MSLIVSLIVREARLSRLPEKMRARDKCKSILGKLADRCDHAGENAWPAVPTIAEECEISTRTAHACLAELEKPGLIEEQEPPRQHRPRTWRLKLEAIAALIPDAQLAARLLAEAAAQQSARLNSGPQVSTPDAQAPAHEQSLSEQSLKTGTPPPSGGSRSRKVYGKRAADPNRRGNRFVLMKLAHEAIDRGWFRTAHGAEVPIQCEGDLIEATKLAARQVNVVEDRPKAIVGACAQVWWLRRERRKPRSEDSCSTRVAV